MQVGTYLGGRHVGRMEASKAADAECRLQSVKASTRIVWSCLVRPEGVLLSLLYPASKDRPQLTAYENMVWQADNTQTILQYGRAYMD